jgi:hypothetical protein
LKEKQNEKKRKPEKKRFTSCDREAKILHDDWVERKPFANSSSFSRDRDGCGRRPERARGHRAWRVAIERGTGLITPYVPSQPDCYRDAKRHLLTIELFVAWP